MALVNATKRVDAINVGSRVRKDPGNLSDLADSIGRLGLLHPIVVSPSDDLLAGWRRLEAVKLLGLEEVPVRIATDVADLRDALAVESDENGMRKDFTPSEADAMRRAIEALEKPKAKERQRAGASAGGRAQGSANLAEPSPRPRDVAAKATGRSTETLRKTAHVIDTAGDESLPESVRARAAAAAEQMDVDGKVDPAYQETQDAIADHVAEVLPDLVQREAGRSAAKAIRKLLTDLKSVDPDQAGAGTRQADHLDLHIEKVDHAIAWLAAYRKAVIGLAIVKEATQ